MQPNNIGMTRFDVVDEGVEEVETASAVLHVSDIGDIQITGGGLIEVGSNVNISVQVFDTRGY